MIDIPAKICSDKASRFESPWVLFIPDCDLQNKPNGQFQMPFTREAVMEFMRDLPVRKVPGIGRVGERVLEAIGVRVREKYPRLLQFLTASG